MSKDSGIVDIHGKQYFTVAKRVGMFREKHPDFRLLTEIVFRDEECVVMRAMIADTNGNVLATGHSEEYRAASKINATSALENSETSAIGRALAALGLGGTEFASADEVARAVSGQKGAAHKNVATEVWDTMDVAAQMKLQGIADEARAKIDAGDVPAAVEIIEKENLDADSKVALWSRFNSKERSAMKTAQRKAA